MSNNIGNKTIFLSSQMSLQKYKNFLIMKGAYGILKIKIKIPLYITFKNLALFLKISNLKSNNFKFKKKISSNKKYIWYKTYYLSVK